MILNRTGDQQLKSRVYDIEIRHQELNLGYNDQRGEISKGNWPVGK